MPAMRTLMIASCLVAAIACKGKEQRNPTSEPIASDSARAQPEVSLGAAVDAIVEKAMKGGGVPGAWVAVVKDGTLTYSHAYGEAKVAPKIPARLDMGFPIASISKQFVSTAVLMLAEEGKLGLDDPVAT